MINFPSTVKRILVTGGAGFIGGTLVRRLLNQTDIKVFNLDKLTYASNLDGIKETIRKLDINIERYNFLKVDLADKDALRNAIKQSDPDLVFHLAAESHVDNSISVPETFLKSNVIGTFNLLESLMSHWESLSSERRKNFKLIHISTDEVFGSLGESGLFSENSRYDPRSPYSATKAASDHLVKAWHYTYGLPVLISNSSNNFGPWQFPEKLIPVIIKQAISNKSIPIYGNGKNIRDWIYVEDHIDGLLTLAIKGKEGDSYCLGGGQQKNNLEVVDSVCKLLDEFKPQGAPHKRLIKFIKDRPGHDKRYGIDANKIKKDFSWEPKYDFDKSLFMTVKWYLDNVNFLNKN